MSQVTVTSFGWGSTQTILVCNQCHSEQVVGKTVPYEMKCSNGCGYAKTTRKMMMLNGKVHKFVAISTTSKKFQEYLRWKEKLKR